MSENATLSSTLLYPWNITDSEKQAAFNTFMSPNVLPFCSSAAGRPQAYRSESTVSSEGLNSTSEEAERIKRYLTATERLFSCTNTRSIPPAHRCHDCTIVPAAQAEMAQESNRCLFNE
ncbi:hypothetical protein MHYP_G00168270 [Metynnis hypsauchen]